MICVKWVIHGRQVTKDLKDRVLAKGIQDGGVDLAVERPSTT